MSEAGSPPPAIPVSEFRTGRQVEFADTDLAGIVHFARFFVYMETAEHEFLRSLGHPVHTRIDGREVGWPRKAASCAYESPARFGDRLDIHLKVERKGRSSLTYAFTISCQDRRVASGSMTAACCVLDDKGSLRSIPIPESLAARIAEARTAD